MAEPTFRQYCENRLNALEDDRRSWWNHWRELAEYILPRRYKWLITPNEGARGSPINGRIIDSTGTIAARTLSAGMMSGITSPTRPWFKLTIDGFDTEETHPVSIWLAECRRRMMRVMQESNFYNSMAVLFSDLSVFNTGAMLIYEDFDDVIRCYNPCAGEYYLANSDRMKVDTFYRKFTMTVHQVVQRFGLDNCSANIKRLYEQSGQALAQEIVIAHGMEPNDNNYSEVSKKFPYRECYWEWGSTQAGVKSDGPEFLECKGFNELPGLFPRWDIVGNDAYGRGPSMDALGDIKQLQQETKRKAQAIDKMVNPPIIADVQLKNQPASLLPGGVTYVAGLANSVGMKPIYQVNPPIQEIMLDIKEVQERIRNIFFNDLFMMISQLQTVRTATEIDARREEKLVMLGPVLERFENEALDPAIDRIFNIMLRANLLPPPPEEIQGKAMQVVYVSMLAEAQKAMSTTAIERVFAMAGNFAAIKPDVLDVLDADEGLTKYANYLALDPTIINGKDKIDQIRQARAQQEQQIQQLQMTDAAVKGAKTLSETDVGGGKNALQSMLQ